MMWQVTEAPEDLWRMRGVVWRMLRGRLVGNVGGEYMEAVGTAHASGAMLPLLAMGRDVPGGAMSSTAIADARLGSRRRIQTATSASSSAARAARSKLGGELR